MEWLKCCLGRSEHPREVDEWASPLNPAAAAAAPGRRSAPLPIRRPEARGRVASGDLPVGFTATDYGAAYELGPIIGRGSTSTVHRSKHKASGRVVATKVITGEQLRCGFEGLADQFEPEITALRRCRHPNIIRLEDAIVGDSRLYLVTEHLDGGELFDYVVKRGTLSEAEAAAILSDLADAVRFMHQQGARIIHRDLKPENLLLAREPPRGTFPEVKIIDFGLSKLCEVENVATSFLGTRGYLAPEMLKRPAASVGSSTGASLADARRGPLRITQKIVAGPRLPTRRQRYSKAVDMWAFGVIAYILLCGCLPFDDDAARRGVAPGRGGPPSRHFAQARVTSPECRGKFDLRYPSWAQALSPGAKHLLASLLDVDPSRAASWSPDGCHESDTAPRRVPPARRLRRATADQVVAHPWLRGESAPPENILRSPAMLSRVPRTPTVGRRPPTREAARDGRPAVRRKNSF